MKFILPFLSEYLFRKIGYGAMVISGIFLLVNTSRNIIQKDHVSFSKNEHDETTMNWRNSSFVLEFAIDDGLEIERRIEPDELPSTLKAEYDRLQAIYDKIYLEKVFKIGTKPSYELYCYKDNKLTKIELNN